MAIYGSLGDLEVNADYPSIQPTLDLNFAKTKSLDPRITFYRNSLATYTDDKGIIRTVPENVPRFDHNPTTGESLGLLIEESRTNIALYSQALNNSSVWGQYASTVSQDSTISPSGQSDAYKITLGASPTGTYQGILQGINLSTSNYYTFSCFVKAGNQSIIKISESFSFGYSITANLSTKQITSNGGYVVSQGIQEYPNGWFRIYGVWDLRSISGPTYTVWDIYLGTNSTSGLHCYAWGPQLEAGSFPTSYIPTSGSTVTRSADFVEMSGTNFSNWYNSIESTFYTNYIINSLDAAYNNPSFYAYDNASAQNYLAIFGYNPAYAWAQASNATAAGISLGGTTTTNVDYKVSFGVKVNDFAASINGSAVSTDASGNVPVVSQMFIGKRVEVSNAHLNGTLKRLTYYPKRLTNTQLQNLTA